MKVPSAWLMINGHGTAPTAKHPFGNPMAKAHQVQQNEMMNQPMVADPKQPLFAKPTAKLGK